VLPRRILGGDGARLRQDRRQAHHGDGARHRGTAARVDGHLQRLRRPGAGLRRHRQHRRRAMAAERRRMDPRRAGRGGDGPRLHEIRRFTDLADAVRRVRCARVQDRHDAPDGPRGAGGRCGVAGRADLTGGPASSPRSEAVNDLAAGRRFRSRRRSRADAGRQGRRMGSHCWWNWPSCWKRPSPTGGCA